jgi:hypothetical protein
LLNDPSKLSLKAVLLLNGYKFPSVTTDHAANMKEFMTLHLEKKIQYERYNWNICKNCMVIALLLGLQLG